MPRVTVVSRTKAATKKIRDTTEFLKKDHVLCGKAPFLFESAEVMRIHLKQKSLLAPVKGYEASAVGGLRGSLWTGGIRRRDCGSHPRRIEATSERNEQLAALRNRGNSQTLKQHRWNRQLSHGIKCGTCTYTHTKAPVKGGVGGMILNAGFSNAVGIIK